MELFDLNRGRAEPGGHLLDPNLIYAGWKLSFPLGATGLPTVTASTSSVAAHGTGKATQTSETQTTDTSRIFSRTLVAAERAAVAGQHALGSLAGWSI